MPGIKNHFLLLLLISLTPLPGQAGTGEIIEACTQLVHDYAIYRDRWDAEAYADLFTADGELVLPGNRTIKGRDAIRQRISDERDTRHSRHMMNTIKIFPLDDTHATGISYLYIIEVPASEAEVLPVDVDQFIIAEYHDSFELTTEGWRFSKRIIKPVFTFRDD